MVIDIPFLRMMHYWSWQGLSSPQILQLSQKLKMDPPCLTVDDFTASWKAMDKERVSLELYKEYA